MIRITRGNVKVKKRKKFFKLSKGFKQQKTYTHMKEQTFQSLFSKYIGRRLKKREFKSYQIILLNSVIQNLNLKFHNFLGKLRKNKIFLTKQFLSMLSYNNLALISLLIDLI